eukprot:COSAG01_NODE_40027_length_468_cov_3.344173_1_plen_56_part_10
MNKHVGRSQSIQIVLTTIMMMTRSVAPQARHLHRSLRLQVHERHATRSACLAIRQQ